MRRIFYRTKSKIQTKTVRFNISNEINKKKINTIYFYSKQQTYSLQTRQYHITIVMEQNISIKISLLAQNISLFRRRLRMRNSKCTILFDLEPYQKQRRFHQRLHQNATTKLV